MAQKILLISTNIIKQETVIENNVDDKVLARVIFNVQEIQLKAILGKPLYDNVCDEARNKVANPNYVYADFFQELINVKIKNFLLAATIAEFIPINNYKISSKGIQKLNDNSAANIDSKELEYYKNYYDNFSTTSKKELLAFLKLNNALENNKDTDTTSNGIGWFLGIEDSCYNNVSEELIKESPFSFGKSAYQVAVENGFVGTEVEWLASLQGAKGDTGLDGAFAGQGYSAYEIAVINGYVGTEVEWLISLKGERGIQGIQGEMGEDSGYEVDGGFASEIYGIDQIIDGGSA